MAGPRPVCVIFAPYDALGKLPEYRCRYLVDEYDGSLPLHHYLKHFFKARPHMGSRDRRRIQQLVYPFFRLGKWPASAGCKRRMLLGAFLCEQAPDALLGFFKPEWNERVTGTVTDKLQFLGLTWDAASAFPFLAHLSRGIEPEALTLSYLQQPRLYIRVRPGKEAAYPAFAGNCRY